MALVKAGLQIPGQTIVKAGKLRGRRIEHNVVKLAHYLARKELLGPSKRFASASEARSSIQGEGRKGIVAYFKLNGPTDSQNHIDVVGPGAGGYAECGSGCYWGSVSAWSYADATIGPQSAGSGHYQPVFLNLLLTSNRLLK